MSQLHRRYRVPLSVASAALLGVLAVALMPSSPSDQTPPQGTPEKIAPSPPSSSISPASRESFRAQSKTASEMQTKNKAGSEGSARQVERTLGRLSSKLKLTPDQQAQAEALLLAAHAERREIARKAKAGELGTFEARTAQRAAMERLQSSFLQMLTKEQQAVFTKTGLGAGSLGR